MVFKSIAKVGMPLAGGALGGFFGGPAGAAAGAQAGGALSGAFFGEQPRDMQEVFAKHGIRWRVADAKAAGIHPLYALGAQTHSYTPTSVGQPDLASMGANIADSVSRTSTASQRTQMVLSDLAIERASLENNLIRQQIEASRVATMASLRQPAFPTSTTARTGSPELDALVERTPMQQTPTIEPHQEPAHNPAVGYIMNPDGSQMPVMGEQAKQRLEEDFPGMLWWNFLNRLLPNLGMMQSPPSTPPKPGYEWYYDRGLQSYKQRPISSSGSRRAPAGFRDLLLHGDPRA